MTMMTTRTTTIKSTTNSFSPKRAGVFTASWPASNPF